MNIEHFYNPSDTRPYVKAPFYLNGFKVATDGISLIRIPAPRASDTNLKDSQKSALYRLFSDISRMATHKRVKIFPLGYTIYTTANEVDFYTEQLRKITDTDALCYVDSKKKRLYFRSGRYSGVIMGTVSMDQFQQHEQAA